MTPKNYMLGFKENVWEKCYENESMWQPGDGRGFQEGGDIWFVLTCDRAQHNIAEKSSSNTRILFYTSQYCTIVIFDN